MGALDQRVGAGAYGAIRISALKKEAMLMPRRPNDY
jgi:hypothetical protein